MRAIETTGILNVQGQLQLDTPQPQAKPSRVRIIMLIAEDDELNPQDWESAASVRIPGQDKDTVWIADDFNAPLPDSILNDFLNPL